MEVGFRHLFFLLSFKYLRVGKDNKDISFTRVTDPHLATIQDIVIALVLSTGLQSKSITAGTSFRDTETANGIGGQTGEILFLEFLATPLADNSVGKGVL